MLENFRLTVFRTVAKHLSFRKAGEALCLTQPAITLQIKALEEGVGARLFERNPSGVRLTEAGQVLLPYAQKLHALALEAQTKLAALKGETSGQLVLGSSTTIAQYVLPRILSDFAKRFPGIRLEMVSGNTEAVLQGVADGRFALGLIEGPPLRRDLRIQRWFEDELLLVVPPAHPWAEVSSIHLQQLQGVPLVMRERGSGSRHVVEQCLQAAGIRLDSLQIVMELASTEAILSCVEEGLGVGFVSEWALTRRSRSLSTLRLTGTPIRRSFSFAVAQSPELEGAAATLRQFLQSRAPVI